MRQTENQTAMNDCGLNLAQSSNCIEVFREEMRYNNAESQITRDMKRYMRACYGMDEETLEHFNEQMKEELK